METYIDNYYTDKNHQQKHVINNMLIGDLCSIDHRFHWQLFFFPLRSLMGYIQAKKINFTVYFSAGTPSTTLITCSITFSIGKAP
jgi:hypothetical protein